jgi:hypothetical protein
MYAQNNAVGNRYADDIYMIHLDDVSLTCTPASEANSTETIAAVTGLRVDGYDTCTQPVTDLTAAAGSIRFRVNFRHDAADWIAFGQALMPIMYQWENANNYIYVAVDLADRITLAYNAQGAGAVTGNWTPTGLVANTWYEFEVRYTGGACTLTVDSVEQIALPGFSFTADPTVAVDWGNRYDGVFQLDGVLAAPA